MSTLDSTLDREVISNIIRYLVEDQKYAVAHKSLRHCDKCWKKQGFAPCKDNCDIKRAPAAYHYTVAVPTNTKELLDCNFRGRLHAAVAHGDYNTANMALRAGVNPIGRSRASMTPMYFAIFSGCVHVVQLLIDWGNDVNESIPSVELQRYIPILHFAVMLNKPRIVQLLLHYGADVNACDSGENTALHLASRFGHFEITQILLAHGSRTNDLTIRNCSPLLLSIQYRRSRIFRHLLKYGADLRQWDHANNRSLLDAAIEHYEATIFRKLLHSQPDVSAPTSGAETPLHHAVQADGKRCKSKCCSYCRLIDDVAASRCASVEGYATYDLLKHGARPDARNKAGKTPLHLAVECGCKHVVQILLDFEADINAVDNAGRSVLQLEAAKALKCFEIIKMLLVYGADYEALMMQDQFFGMEDFTAILARFLTSRRVAGFDVKADFLMAESNPKSLEEFEDSCRIELEEMKKEVLVENTTVWQLLRADKQKLVNIMSWPKACPLTKKMPGIVDRYPIYGQMVRRNCMMGVKLAKVFKKTAGLLNRVLEQKLPVVPIWRIVSYLEHEEMRMFIKTVDECSGKTK